MMASTVGVRKIVSFNWPWYLLALLGNLCAAVLIFAAGLPNELKVLSSAATLVGNGWLVASLLVSHWVYDRSPLARGAWLDALDESARDIAVLHAGQDEASLLVAQRFPNAQVTVYDFFDPRENTEASLKRARRSASLAATTPVRLDQLPLGEAALDIAVVVFAAHEIRCPERLAAFFSELRRVLRPSGVVVVVEHLRDGWNALAYGPGTLHFLSRSTWVTAFAAANLRLIQEVHYTPFVTRFCLTKGA
jgi:SAM-dependent methyltransferase